MQQPTPGKFDVVINGEERRILISLGLKSEVQRVISLKQLEYYNVSQATLLSPAIKQQLDELKTEIEALQKADPQDKDLISAKQQELTVLYEQGMSNLQDNITRYTKDLAIAINDMADNALASIAATLLTERDSHGVTTKKVTSEDILWSETYVESMEEITELVVAVIDYITPQVKKSLLISKVISGNQQQQIAP